MPLSAAQQGQVHAMEIMLHLAEANLPVEKVVHVSDLLVADSARGRAATTSEGHNDGKDHGALGWAGWSCREALLSLRGNPPAPFFCIAGYNATCVKVLSTLASLFDSYVIVSVFIRFCLHLFI